MSSFLVNHFLFRPAKANEFWQSPPTEISIQDLFFDASGITIHAWWSAPAAWTPAQGAMLYCHGNAGNLSSRGDLLRRWQKTVAGGVLIFDYPGYGRSGGKPTEAGCYAAAESAYQWLTSSVGVPEERIVLYGGSLGAAVALEMAIRKIHRATVLISAFTSVRDMARKEFPWLPLGWLIGDSFNNLAKIGRTGRPIFLAHGTADTLVPFSQGERLYGAAAEPKRFFPMPGQDHNQAASPDCHAALVDFLARFAP